MGRRRTSNFHLPQRVYLQHGRHWFVDKSGAWHDLGKKWDVEAKKKWSLLSENPETYGSFIWWFDAFMERRKQLVVQKQLSPRTYADNEKEQTFLKAFFGKKASPADVIPADVRDYLDHRGKVAWVRANRERALLSSFYTWLIGKRDTGVRVNPCIGVKRNTETKRERIIEDWEYSKVYDRSRAAKRTQAVPLMMALIYKSAQRPEDLIDLGPRSIRTIDHEGKQVKVIRIIQRKTGAAIDIIVTPDLDVLLRECMGLVVNLDRPFIAKRNGRQFTYDGLSAMFRRHVRAAKLTDFGFYDLRGKAATDMYRDGTSIERIQQLLGHESVTTTEIYLKARMPTVVKPNDRQIKATPPGESEAKSA